MRLTQQEPRRRSWRGEPIVNEFDFLVLVWIILGALLGPLGLFSVAFANRRQPAGRPGSSTAQEG